jgi:plasmid maintenance system antidote protein VapI
MAIRFGAAFPNTTAEFWLKVQENYDLAKVKPKVDTSHIRVFWNPQIIELRPV